jgi:hypothetical protein
MIHLLALSLALVPSGPMDGVLPVPTICPAGREARIEIRPLRRPRFLSHDQNIGGDRLVLRESGARGRELFSLDLDDGHWTCLAVDVERGRHVVGGLGESGAWFVLRSVSYLDEGAPRLQPSRFTKAGYTALSSLASSTGRYLAFVGGVQGVDGLYVLDTRQDTIRRLAAPPAPPPVADFTSAEPFDWGPGWADGDGPLEASVLRFEGDDTLVATYGRDTHRARAKRRKVRRFKL